MPAAFPHFMALMQSLTSSSVRGLVLMSRAISAGGGSGRSPGGV